MLVATHKKPSERIGSVCIRTERAKGDIQLQLFQKMPFRMTENFSNYSLTALRKSLFCLKSVYIENLGDMKLIHL